jgi:cytoplasmic FMR1 interacting protein
MSALITLADTEHRVTCLNELPLNDNQPCVEALCGTLVYQANLDSNFNDKTAYIRGISKYIEEAAKHAELNDLLDEGNEHATMLYTWRCCSRAIPQVKSNDQQNRMQIYERTVDVLTPHIQKLRQLMLFKDKAINEFCNEIKRLCHPKKEKEFVSEAYLLTLGKFINMFAVLDELKNMKSSVKNDYSAYKRAAQQIHCESGKESQDLSMFLATNDVIRSTLKRALDDPTRSCTGYEEILADIVNASVQMFENRMYLLPQEKHVLIKVIGFSLNLLDSDTTNINKLDSKKRISLNKIDKIFKQYKVVPLYGDMQITPFSYIMKTRNYDESKWPACTAKDSESTQGKILEQIDRIRSEHSLFMIEIAKYSNEVSPILRLSFFIIIINIIFAYNH